MRQDNFAQVGAESAAHGTDAEPNVYIIDQDRSLRLSLAALLKASGYLVRIYDRAEDFLNDVVEPQPSCLLADVRLPGMSGPELQRAVRRSDMPLGVVFMSGHADIRLAVAAIRGGAVDFIQKPFDLPVLLASIRAALLDARRRYRNRSEIGEALARFNTLSAREREVMRLMIEGYPTKIAARRLGVSPRTIESHRTRVMEKMGARTLPALVRQGLILERFHRQSNFP